MNLWTIERYAGLAKSVAMSVGAFEPSGSSSSGTSSSAVICWRRPARKVARKQ